MIYLDNNSTTAVDQRVVDAMLPYFCEIIANPGATHQAGAQARAGLENARAQVANLLGAQTNEVVFTSGGTEANNLALKGCRIDAQLRPIVLLSSVEHSSVRALADYFKGAGFTVKKMRVTKTGAFDMKFFDKLLEEHGKKISIVSLMLANNETGVLMPVEEVATKVKALGALFHVDGVQSVGKRAIDMSKIPIDLLSLSAHKFYGPKGAGALFVRQGLILKPLLEGGGHELNRRSGTQAMSALVGLGKACEIAVSEMQTRATTVLALAEYFREKLRVLFPDSLFPGDGEIRMENTVTILFKNLESESLLMNLDQRGICASAGSACSANSHEPSYVIKAMNLPRAWLNGPIRFSLSHHNTREELDKVLAVLPEIVEMLS